MVGSIVTNTSSGAISIKEWPIYLGIEKGLLSFHFFFINIVPGIWRLRLCWHNLCWKLFTIHINIYIYICIEAWSEVDFLSALCKLCHTVWFWIFWYTARKVWLHLQKCGFICKVHISDVQSYSPLSLYVRVRALSSLCTLWKNKLQS